MIDFKSIDKLSSSDFEIFVRDVFVAAGWTDATITQVGKEFSHGDGGVDIFAYKNKRTFAIEVKQRQRGVSVDVKALNQLVTGAKLARVAHMILVTNSYFTSEVKIRALRLGVELVDRDALQNLWVEKRSEIGREIKPRVYQESVIQECFGIINSGKQKMLIEMATGLGKTYTVAHLVKRVLQNRSKQRVLFLAHQIEILLQSVTAFKNVFGIGNHSFSACFDGSNPENTDFVFGSFDTLHIKINDLSKNEFDIVIVDEAHHVPARTYSTVVKHFNPKYLIGLTATPFREDIKDVLAFFGGTDGHIGKYDLAWALRHNKLAFPKYLVLLDDLDQRKIDQLKQGLSISDLDNHLFLHKKDEEVVRIIEQTIQDKKIANPKGIIFCRRISHINHLIQFFPSGSATYVHSKMSDQQRRQNIRDFRESGFRYILVCDLFNEGIDIPETNLLVFMRYTGSRTVWLQQLGRGLRKTSNKEYVNVLDFVGSFDRLNEVQQLKKIIENTPIDNKNWEKPPHNKHSKYSDTSLEVIYNQSAAEVLKLIKDLEYRLKSRSQAIEKLEKYYNLHKKIPNFENVHEQLKDITRDQIATHFDSYWGYIQATFPQMSVPVEFKKRCQKYLNNFWLRNSIQPSSQAISSASKENNLLLYTEQEVDNLRESPDEYNTNSFHTSSEISKKNIEPKRDINGETEMKNKYAKLILIPSDLKQLSTKERQQIKDLFQSEFFFINQLKLYRERINND